MNQVADGRDGVDGPDTVVEPFPNPEPSNLQSRVESLLQRKLGRHVSVERLERRPNPYRSIFPTERVRVRLSKGRNVFLFLKHLGDEEADHPDKQCRDREVRMYRELLGAPGLPVVEFIGALQNRGGIGYELYLEYVDGWKLKYHEAEYWYLAAKALARLHAHFSRRADRLRKLDYLLRLDETYFTAWLDRASAEVTRTGPELVEVFDLVRQGYPTVVRLLTGAAGTLVHNDLSAKNVLVDVGEDPPRVCFVDWEMAGVGTGVLDLARLKYDRLEPEQEARFVAEYRQELGRQGQSPGSPDEFGRRLLAAELHTTVYRIAHRTAWGESEAYLTHRVQRARRMWSKLGSAYRTGGGWSS